MIMAVIGMTAGGALPMLFGDNDPLGGWSIIGGMVGGFVGIWLGVKLSQRFG